MASLTVRNLDDELVKQLRIRAAEKGRSAEAEHREILRAALKPQAPKISRAEAAERVAAFRRELAGYNGPSSEALIQESRALRMEGLTGRGDDL